MGGSTIHFDPDKRCAHQDLVLVIRHLNTPTDTGKIKYIVCTMLHYLYIHLFVKNSLWFYMLIVQSWHHIGSMLSSPRGRTSS